MISIRKLIKKYGDLVALNGIDLEIKSGEILGLLGHNGAGKTTLMKIITGILPYNFGEVLIDGMSVLDFSKIRKIKKMIGYLPEFCPLYMDMKVIDFLSFFAKIRGVNKSDLKDRIDMVLNAVNLKEKKDKFIFSLSKGYRQRVGIAQALIHNPKILILDEPTSGLDPIRIREIRDLIQSLKEDRTIILSTHILTEASHMCDRIVIISNGNIKIQGTEEEILRSFEDQKIQLKLSSDSSQNNIINLLSEIPGVNSVNIYPKYIEVDYSLNNDPSYNIAKTLVSKNIPFTEIVKKRSSLEKAFIQLTDN